jgi:hypothetical protein
MVAARGRVRGMAFSVPALAPADGVAAGGFEVRFTSAA